MYAGINEMRRYLMRALTCKIGGIVTNRDISMLQSISLQRILIVRPNSRLGNQLMLTPLLQEIEAHFPTCKVDIFVRGNLAPILFKNYPNLDRIIKLPGRPFKCLFSYLSTWISLREYKYDMVINVEIGSSSGRLATKLAKSNIKFYSYNIPELLALNQDYVHMAKCIVYNFRDYLTKSGYLSDKQFVPELSLRLDSSEMTNGASVLRKITESEKPTICIYTFATGTKCYSKDWWKEVYQKLNETYGESYNIVEVLPKENISQIDFTSRTYYSLDLREMGAVIANSSIFITADCGIMHLASSVGVPTIGMFSITNSLRYAPYNKGSIAVETSKTSAEELISLVDRHLKCNLA
ncbi:glycosyltransferase family 9 protein [Dysgonomonas macrotermitis]|uniref:ADP-heptose:LPS heptosyltransferase n=1 Tax=Dysgonomonas macrotermitis TaxID=1346286 RepID=A0A1M4TRC2_9BACT|nr:glycosyltransferase family 9 protein [Dysgonomonas macrotermitis]SHE46958.1 ADP-heptose:LPS heptosyltransferase [Dysgonomonas macrotermitis]